MACLPIVSPRSNSRGPPRVATSEPYVTSRNVRDVAEVLEKYMRSNALLVAVLEGDSDEVRRIVDGGHVRIDRTDPFGNSALHVAAHSGHCSIARLLMRRRVAVDATNCDGWTPLHFASLQSDVHMLQTLLAAGADVNARDIALRTPLHVACHTGRALEALKALLRGGALIDARSANNNTPLLLCSELNDRPAAMLLASVGASVTNTRTLDKGGRTPEGWATKHGWRKQLMLGSLAPGRPLAPVVNRVEGKCIGIKWLFPYVANEDATLEDVDAYKANGANVDCFEVQTGYVPRSAQLANSTQCRFPFAAHYAPSVMSDTVGAPTARSRDVGTPLTEATRPRTQSTLATVPGTVAAPSSRYAAGSIVISARPSEGECSFIYRYSLRESCSQVDSLPYHL